MKDDDILLYGGIAFLAYLFLVKKPVAAGAVVAPVNTSLFPVSSAVVQPGVSNTSLVTSLSNLATQLFGGSSSTANNAPLTSYDPITTNLTADSTSILQNNTPSLITSYTVPDYSSVLSSSDFSSAFSSSDSDFSGFSDSLDFS